VAIAKGAVFCLPQYIDSSAAVVFGELRDEDCLRGLRRDAFVGMLAHYLINFLWAVALVSYNHHTSQLGW
jgi:hypothetical protein